MSSRGACRLEGYKGHVNGAKTWVIMVVEDSKNFLAKIRSDKIRNEVIREKVRVDFVTNKMREDIKMVWAFRENCKFETVVLLCPWQQLKTLLIIEGGANGF
ncbi:hypothetical protein H5410_002065 [Solanum commersonii]|uniref:Uncharacterized protein n=1 Tax=Solanum commersonii TaxID=4109 RepID=A0A9J6B108_SOLCO|nr:hypothetical protein H5410_002065 [Solanum commersonii]